MPSSALLIPLKLPDSSPQHLSPSDTCLVGYLYDIHLDTQFCSLCESEAVVCLIPCSLLSTRLGLGYHSTIRAQEVLLNTYERVNTYSARLLDSWANALGIRASTPLPSCSSLGFLDL